MTRRALVVEDEPDLAHVVTTYLEREGFDVRWVPDGLSAVVAVQERVPDVVILDLGLPGIDGIEVCRRLRTFTDCYVLMLTARTDEVDKIVGLGVGADDYLTKPFSPRELVARVQTVLRRPRSGDVAWPRHDGIPPRVFGPLVVDVESREVLLDGNAVELTPTEFDLLSALSGRPRLAFTRHQLIAEIWGEGWVGDEHLVDVHIGNLRRKLGDSPSASRFVRTVRGVGYRMGDGG